MNARFVLALLLLAAFPAAHAAEAAATVSMPTSAAPAQSSPIPAPASGPVSNTAAPQPTSTPTTSTSAEPKAAEPKAAEPKVAEPKAAKPKVAKPQAAEPKAAERRHRPSRHAKARHTAREHEKKPGRHERPRRAKAGAAALDVAEGRNPVIEAINLVMSKQRAEIQAADRKVSESDWWSDTLERDWIVRRPFGPGIFDSTHWFYVSYKVNGRILMSWFVDLSKGTVSDIAPPERKDSH